MKNLTKNQKATHRRGAEFYFVNCACGAINKTKLFSVSLRLDNCSCVILLTGFLP